MQTCCSLSLKLILCARLFLTLDLRRKGCGGKNSDAGNMLGIYLFLKNGYKFYAYKKELILFSHLVDMHCVM